MNLELVEQLYNLQSDPSATPEQQAEAREQIAAITDSVVETYLGTLLWDESSRKGSRKFEDYQVLYCRNCIEGQILGEDGRTETNPPREDRVGNVLFHRRYSQRSSTETVQQDSACAPTVYAQSIAQNAFEKGLFGLVGGSRVGRSHPRY
jgi:hypothetical protein